MGKNKYLIQAYGSGDFTNLLKSLNEMIASGHEVDDAVFVHYHPDTITIDPLTGRKFYKPFGGTIKELRDKINELLRSSD